MIRVAVVTGADGGFKFRVTFYKARQRFGPDYDKVPRQVLAKHGDTLKLGDLKLDRNATEE